MVRLLISCLVFAVGSLAHAQEAAAPASGSPNSAVCKQGGNRRRIEVQPGEVDSKHSCLVRYFKNQEAPSEGKVLWSAVNQEGYCIDKAKGFVAKLAGQGWACEGGLSSK